jgi:hypothetical protein
MAALEIGHGGISFGWNPSSIYRVVGARAWCHITSDERGGESPGGASRGGGHDRLIHVVRATG